MSRDALRRLLSADFTRGIAIIASGSALAQAIPVLLTPVLTRLYEPTEMGQLGLYTAFISFAASATTLGYSQAIVAGRKESHGADLVTISALLVAPISLLASLLLLALTSSGGLGYGSLSSWTSLAMAISLVLTGLYFTLRAWMLRTAQFRTISSATVSQSVGRMATQIVLGLFGFGWGGLISGEILGRAAGLRSMWSGSRASYKSSASGLNIGALWRVATTYKKFPLLTVPSALLNSLALVLPVPLITTYYGLGVAGQYSVAMRVLILPLSLIGASVGDVFYNRVAELSRSKPELALSLFLRVSGGLFAAGLIPLLLVSFAGDWLFAIVLGPSWELAGSIAAVLTPWVLMQFAVGPVSRVVQVYQGQELKLIYDLLGLASIVGVLSSAHSRGWSLLTACTVLGWSQAMVYAVYFVLLLRIVQRGSSETPADS
jgi:O-antigen/teichoic acid export membrane protein